MAWTDFLGGALSVAPQLLERRRQFEADQEARKQQQQFQQIQLALMGRDQELQEQDNRRDILKEAIASVGPNGVIEGASPELVADAQRFLPGRLKQQEGTLSSTQVRPGDFGQALPTVLEDGGVVVGGGGEVAQVASPGQQAGLRVVPNVGEQAAIDQTADAARQRKLRDVVLTELESGRAFAQPPAKLEQLRAIGASVGIQIPATFQEWKDKQDYEQQQRLEVVDAQGDNALRTAQARVSGMSGGGAPGGGLTPEGLETAAYQYLQTGQMPPLGMGASGARMAILNRAGQLAATAGNPQVNAALYKADSATLTQLQKSTSSLNAFENTAGKNIQVLKAQLAKIADSGSPVLNMPMRALSRYSGDPAIAAFDAARTTLVPEISRILANPNLVGVLSDSARHEGDRILDPNMTVAQFASVLSVLEQDMLNRKTSLDEELATVISRLQSRAPGGAPAPTPTPGPTGATGATAPVVGSPQSRFGNVRQVP